MAVNGRDWATPASIALQLELARRGASELGALPYARSIATCVPMGWIHELIFLSDAGRVALLGLAFVVVALIAMVAERRRGKRARIDRVGLMPWITIFVFCAVIGGGLIAAALPALVRG